MTHADRLLIVHGFGASPQDHWFPWLAALHPRAERIALPDPLSPRPETWVPLVAAALDRLGDGTAVVAHSLGNATALQALRALVDAGHPVHLSAFVGVAPFVSPVPPAGDPQLDAFLGESPSPAGAQERRTASDAASPPGSAPQHAFYEGLDLHALRPVLGSVRVLRSDDDPIVPSRLSDDVATGLGVRAHVVTGAGHFLAEDGVRELPEAVPAPVPSGTCTPPTSPAPPSTRTAPTAPPRTPPPRPGSASTPCATTRGRG